MRSLWNDREALLFASKYREVGYELALRTYSARLIGAEPSLVLHGGGNTSVKTAARLLTGEEIPVLRVKGSGRDLAVIDPDGHPAIRLDALRGLRRLERLADEDMVAFQRANLLDTAAPNPSIETLLHAFLPRKFIDHTHADAVLAVIDQPDAERAARRWCGKTLGLVPYIKPGFDLARLAAEIFEHDPGVEGLVLLGHGIITFGATARESYERTIKWVTAAENFIEAHAKRSFVPAVRAVEDRPTAASFISPLIRRHGVAAARPFVVRFRDNPAVLAFVNSREAVKLTRLGPPTPDHVIRTKPRPLTAPSFDGRKKHLFERGLKHACARYAAWYRGYVERNASHLKTRIIPLDPYPRVIVVPGVGIFAAATTASSAELALDLYEHAIGVMRDANGLGRYRPLPESELFAIEYWSLEQAKLDKSAPGPFDGRIVWISGAASGIGMATAKAFADRGAHVYLTDVDERSLASAAASLGVGTRAAFEPCDVTDARAVAGSFARCARTFGGADIVVSNAGTAPLGEMKSCPDTVLRASFEVNFFAHQNVARATSEIFERQGFGGCLLFNASKGAFNPGPGLGPYNVPKAGVVALMRQYAIELGSIGVRVNAVNADRVRTNLYKDGLLKSRARARGVSVAEYLSGNLLGSEVLAEDVAEAFVMLALAAKTTGAVLPVDGGNPAAFPR